MNNQELSQLRIWRLCNECSKEIYDKVAPNTRYAESVARLLYGTAAQESHMEWERQRSVAFHGSVGGFSKWQLEKGSVEDSLKMLRARPALAQRATRFLFNDPNATTEWLDSVSVDDVLGWLRIDDNDRAGVLFCRLHYLRVPKPIPDSPREQGEYWKDYYNTALGKGTVSEYLKSWYSFWTSEIAQEALKGDSCSK